MGSFEENRESSARELVERLIRQIGARDEQGVVPFVSAWPRIVGTDLAAHTRVLDIRNGAILVGVDHPGWMQRLHLEQKRVIARIQSEFPALQVRYLHFSILAPGEIATETHKAPLKEKSEERTGTPEGPAPPDAASDAAPDAAAPEEDEEFQRHLRGLEQALRKKSRP